MNFEHSLGEADLTTLSKWQKIRHKYITQEEEEEYEARKKRRRANSLKAADVSQRNRSSRNSFGIRNKRKRREKIESGGHTYTFWALFWQWREAEEGREGGRDWISW